MGTTTYQYVPGTGISHSFEGEAGEQLVVQLNVPTTLVGTISASVSRKPQGTWLLTHAPTVTAPSGVVTLTWSAAQMTAIKNTRPSFDLARLWVQVRVGVTEIMSGWLTVKAATADVAKITVETAPTEASELAVDPSFRSRYAAVYFGVACSDETTALTPGTAKVTFRMPFAMTVSAVRANVATASSSGLVTVDINTDGVTMLSTKLSIDASERTSATAATAAVISVPNLIDDSEMTIDLDAAGTNAKGLKVWLIGQRVIA
jgi:hypothetical protein